MKLKILLLSLFVSMFFINSTLAVVEDGTVTVWEPEINEEEVKECMSEWFSLEDCLPMNTIQEENKDDNQIIDKLKEIEDKDEEVEEKIDFELKSFNSCESLENVMWKYIKDYWKVNKDKWLRPMPMYSMDIMTKGAIMEDSAVVNESEWVGWWESEEYSKTNTQVEWVDESDIVKTDGKNIYYYNKSDKNVYIVEVWSLKVIKKIKLPKTFNNVVLYIWNNRLTILATGYSNVNYSRYWINRNTKTYTIVFDTTKIESPMLTKLYVADGSLSKSRKIGKYIYVISNNYFNIPYRNFKESDDIIIDVNKILPKKIDISKVSEKNKQNLELRWKKLPYSISSWNIAKCSDIEYVLPDEATMKKYDFAPSYNIISVIDTEDTSKEVKTKVIAGSSSEIYMSTDNMYLTSHMYRAYDFRCGPWQMCIMPFYNRWENTLIHQISVDWQDLKYSDSNLIPWNPLNQYSMDQYKDKFRIITSTNYPERSTAIYILNKDWLDIHGMLEWIEPWEQFKSSRFIGDKLFLVTFKQVDPLFVISMSDWQNPKILWELKIPGYSTYLHPYDENHLIGLGYDTTENKWWGTMNNGVKLDLYEINYDRKCGDSNLTVEEQEKCDSWDYKWILVKQKYSKTYWEKGSYSEALSNPRMFMWKWEDKKLFLPMTLYKNDKNDSYKKIDFFQWLVVSTIDKDNWINENFRITHMDISKAEKDRNKECLKYTASDNNTKCRELIGGWTYCEPIKRQYIPSYCYKDSTVWEYISSRNWNYRQSFVNRAIWIGDNTYSISDDMIKSSDIDSGKENGGVELIN